MRRTIKALASRSIHKGMIHVVEGQNLECGDKVLVETENTRTPAIVISNDIFSFAMSKNVGQKSGK